MDSLLLITIGRIRYIGIALQKYPVNCAIGLLKQGIMYD